MRVPWTEEYQTQLLEMSHRFFDRVDTVVGAQIWHFADFATSSGITRVDGNKKGVFNPRPPFQGRHRTLAPALGRVVMIDGRRPR
jgi:beta-galactosidase/beta-glucuronidase